ncbi:DUF2752 domain-containing protein [uncultured Brachyspira sp.]|uniref:DUF2752 domain-containing protein n=1 Tax=uncultured Brachyspira sp. TaxID=221953 RepID=UPI0025F94129|nr:DUF2752 domain-containing protein [uncultured Brachyspira sp.]
MIKILKLVLISFMMLFMNYDGSNNTDRYFIQLGGLCLMKNTTGFPCPSCGMTRAYTEAFKLNFKKAFYYHPLFVFPIFIFLLIIFKKKFKIAQYIYNNNYIIIGMLLIFIIVYIIRFILLFPNKEPFTYNYNSNFYIIFKIINNIIK